MLRPENMRWPRPDKDTVKRMYRAYGGNPGDGRMSAIMDKINRAYDEVEHAIEKQSSDTNV